MPLHLRESWRRYWPAGVVLVVGVVITSAVSWELHREAEALDRKRFALRVEELVDQLDGRIEKTEQLLHQAQDFLAWGDHRSRVLIEWCERRQLSLNFPWLFGVAVATNRYAGRWRETLPPKPSRWTRSDWDSLRQLATNEPVECGIAMTVLRRRGVRFLADYQLEGSVSESNELVKAIQTPVVRMSGRRAVMLDNESNQVFGTLFYAPVRAAEFGDFVTALARHEDKAALLPVSRWLNLDAIVLASVNFNALIRSVWDGMESDLGVELFDSKEQTAASWLNAPDEENARPLAADPRFTPYLSKRIRWPTYGRSFSIFCYSTPLFEAHSPKRLARTAMLAGGSLTLLCSALVAVALRARARQARMAEEILEARDALAAAGKERVRLGHDLHDGAIQSLYGIQLGLSRTAENVEAALPEAARVLNETRDRLDEVVVELRQFILAREAGTAPAETVGLDRVLHSMVERLQSTTSARLRVEAQPGAAAPLSAGQAVQLTQLARTALANCLRHADARAIDVSLRHADGSVRLEIADDGAGFNPAHSVNGGTGLQSMRRRVAELGGVIEVQSRPGQGTRIVVEVPTAATG